MACQGITMGTAAWSASQPTRKCQGVCRSCTRTHRLTREIRCVLAPGGASHTGRQQARGPEQHCSRRGIRSQQSSLSRARSPSHTVHWNVMLHGRMAVDGRNASMTSFGGVLGGRSCLQPGRLAGSPGPLKPRANQLSRPGGLGHRH